MADAASMPMSPASIVKQVPADKQPAASSKENPKPSLSQLIIALEEAKEETEGSPISDLEVKEPLPVVIDVDNAELISAAAHDP